MQIQKRIKGYTRRPYGTKVIDEIEHAIEKECARYNVSRSFVIANALAFVFNIKTESYILKTRKILQLRKRA